jgi:hypothetical protein
LAGHDLGRSAGSVVSPSPPFPFPQEGGEAKGHRNLGWWVGATLVALPKGGLRRELSRTLKPTLYAGMLFLGNV